MNGKLRGEGQAMWTLLGGIVGQVPFSVFLLPLLTEIRSDTTSPPPMPTTNQNRKLWLKGYVEGVQSPLLDLDLMALYLNKLRLKLTLQVIGVLYTVCLLILAYILWFFKD